MILILDWSNLIHRAARAGKIELKHPTTGQVTNTFHYTFTMLEHYITMFKPNRILITFDDFRRAYKRKEAYPAYKARRREKRNASDEQQLSRIYSDMREIQGVLEHLPVYMAWCNGMEADDIIAWACRRAYTTLKKTVISTDKDLLQLVNINTDVFYPGKPERTVNTVSWGIHMAKLLKLDESDVPTIENYVSFKAIVGETSASSDNIPGIEGYGPKKAAALLKKYGNYESALNALLLRQVAGKKMSKLETTFVDYDWQNIYKRNMDLMDLNYYLNDMEDIQIRRSSWNGQAFTNAIQSWALAKVGRGSLFTEFSRIAKEMTVESR